MVSSPELLQLLQKPTSSYKVRNAIGFLVRNKAFFLRRDKIKAKEYLDIGCGTNTHENFINLDYSWGDNVDICWDLTQGIPLEDNSVTGIFSEHCLEHLPWDSIDFILSDFYRILKPKGTIRLILPDGELYMSLYTRIVRDKESNLQFPYQELFDSDQEIYTPIMSVNRMFRSFGHQYTYDFETLRLLFEKHNFVNIKRESYRVGRDTNLLIDTKWHEPESLYIEASKPGG